MLVNLNDVLKDAQKNHYGVGLFNTTDTDMLEGAIAAAEELRSPIVIGTAEVLLPFGDLKLIAPSIIAAAKRATVPVVVHYDHGLTFDRCIEALKLGFSSIMFDGSAGDPAKNFENTREMVKIAHSMGVTVEGEIGHVGQADTGDNETSDQYTTPAVTTSGTTGGRVSATGAAGAISESRPRPTRPRPPCFCCDLIAERVGGLTPDAFLRKGFAGFLSFMASPIVSHFRSPCGGDANHFCAFDLNSSSASLLKRLMRPISFGS